ncbi:MAG: hypothetical protein ACTSRT_18495 [Promethearchaeota archaeon]
MNELFEKMTKLNRFGQRDVPPSHGMLMKIHSQVGDLIQGIDLENIDLTQVYDALFEMVERIDVLNTQLTKERSAMWGVIDNHE